MGVFPNGWQQCNSTAVEAFRYLPDRGVLQLVFREGRLVQYDYPCTPLMHQQFLTAPSKGRFVNQVLKPYAVQRGWSKAPYAWTSW